MTFANPSIHKTSKRNDGSRFRCAKRNISESFVPYHLLQTSGYISRAGISPQRRRAEPAIQLGKHVHKFLTAAANGRSVALSYVDSVAATAYQHGRYAPRTELSFESARLKGQHTLPKRTVGTYSCMHSSIWGSPARAALPI